MIEDSNERPIYREKKQKSNAKAECFLRTNSLALNLPISSLPVFCLPCLNSPVVAV